MTFPENLKYSKDHEWIRVEADFAYIGITEFAQSELGDIVYVDITSVGKTFKANEVFGSVEAVKTVSDLFMPVSAEVIEVNSGLNSAPETVNSDSYGKGWMIKVKIQDAKEMDLLLDSASYKQLIGK